MVKKPRIQPKPPPQRHPPAALLQHGPRKQKPPLLPRKLGIRTPPAQIPHRPPQALQRDVDMVQDPKHLRRVQRERVRQRQQRRARILDPLPREKQLCPLMVRGDGAPQVGQVVHCFCALLCFVDEAVEEEAVHAAYA